MIRWIGNNLGTLFLSAVLAISAWAAAVHAGDPVEERPFQAAIPIEYRDLPEDLLIYGDYPTNAQVTLRAPQSVWSNISVQDISVFADLSTISEGEQQIPLESELTISPVHVSRISPEDVPLVIEKLKSQPVAVQIVTSGDPALGFRAEDPLVSPTEVIVTGPVSAIDMVAGARGDVNLAGRRESFSQVVPLVAVDAEGKSIDQVELETEVAEIEIPIFEAEQYRPVSVIASITGQEELQAAGNYRISGITVTPSIVVVFSSDQEALDELPGFVRTQPLDIQDATQDVEQRLTLDLPEGIFPVGDQSVTVQVKIEPIETSITISSPVQIQGLGPGLFGQVSPAEVSLLLTGPRIILEELSDEDVQVVADLRDLNVGSYQVEPIVSVLNPSINWEGPNPATVGVTISRTPLPTLTPSQ